MVNTVQLQYCSSHPAHFPCTLQTKNLLFLKTGCQKLEYQKYNYSLVRTYMCLVILEVVQLAGIVHTSVCDHNSFFLLPQLQKMTKHKWKCLTILFACFLSFIWKIFWLLCLFKSQRFTGLPGGTVLVGGCANPKEFKIARKALFRFCSWKQNQKRWYHHNSCFWWWIWLILFAIII